MFIEVGADVVNFDHVKSMQLWQNDNEIRINFIDGTSFHYYFNTYEEVYNALLSIERCMGASLSNSQISNYSVNPPKA